MLSFQSSSSSGSLSTSGCAAGPSGAHPASVAEDSPTKEGGHRGGRGDVTDTEDEEDDEEEDFEEELTADLPKSFYNYDGCCDCSDGSEGSNLLVSSPGQSNLSQEVAEALR